MRFHFTVGTKMDLPESVSNIETYKEVDYMVLRGTCTINVPLDRYTYD
jgi:hypothetical protein